ncbi:MAG TPA: type II toxin-antitoxin system RelE/ParE family toxin [Rhizomicrobium sp.]|jgi:plasmid stabilization system protein ParE|nr:type II toxin-antitoxin system RelE/ParE family toxin [Rhizomicrobium sp.]
MRVVWEPRASVDLLRIWRHIAKDRPIAARGVFDRIHGGVEILAQSPKLGRTGRLARSREFIFADIPYLAIYRINERHKTVEILRIIHAARNWPQED